MKRGYSSGYSFGYPSGYSSGYSSGKGAGRSNKKENSRAGIQTAIGYGILVLMLVGVILGAVGSSIIDDSAHQEINSYLTGFFSSFDKTGINFKITLIDSFYKYARIIAAIWVSGFFLPGFVVIGGIILFKSFAYGFTTAAIVKYFGFYGFVVGFCSYIPQNLFLLPAFFFTSSSAISAICGRLSGRKGYGVHNGQSIPEYVAVLFTGLLCCVVAALTEAFLTPALLEYVRPL